ncbi:Major Facilitator Superfamily protein [Botrimarina colliarenosi]|uniref:Major Facilitator Superfamily protein n=1 Tax=Botrimarina colliarenosi TaxID=2528001 RepID=A0A5C6AIK5_9BACT|nr:MFS transporter [Botrimarina colliarenosi]TWT99892.1 Major Facilitator Superfamily protein [Botrimarina colliarenosi]
MPHLPAPPATARRRDVTLTYANALTWALGNGLVSTTLVVYLALDLGAEGVAVAWLLAAPRFAGTLRVIAPAAIAAGARRGWGRKPVCLAAFAASGVVLSLVPLVAWGHSGAAVGDRPALRIGVLVAAWCVYHLLEYLGGVALWSWLGDLYPRRLRSRLLGGRERWLTLGRVVGIGVSVVLAALWRVVLPDATRWAPLAASATVGTVLMLAALVPLALTTALATRPSATPMAPWETLCQAIRERPYRRLLTFSCWFGFANGLTATAQGMYPKAIGVDYERLQAYRIGMGSGQSAIAPWCGRMVARYGAKRVMLPAQLIVATGPLWFWFATPESAWLVGVAYAVWIAYAGLNVGLDTLKLGLADPRNNAPYLAVYHAASDLVNGVTVLLGGLLYDTLKESDADAMRVFGALFLAGWVCRTLAAPLIMRLDERGV